MAGDIVDNDCDGWIDEETDNGIGISTICNINRVLMVEVCLEIFSTVSRQSVLIVG